MRQFKARIEKPTSDIHAIEVWFEAENIVSAAEYFAGDSSWAAIGIFKEHVVKLIDITPEEKDDVSQERYRRF